MEYFPIFLRLKGRLCLVVGGGEVAARKAALLLRAGADVHIVVPQLGATLSEMAAAGKITHRAKRFEKSDLENCRLVVGATNDSAVNEHVAAAARACSIPVNVVDQPQLCDFIFPSLIDRDPVTVAVSSGGSSPLLARMLRARLESMIPAAYGRMARLLRKYRGDVRQRITGMSQRRRFWEDVIDGPVSELVFSGREQKAEEALQEALRRPVPAARGEVALVGAGPGDPDLLTFRALRLMQKADVVLYDRLVTPEILELVRREARRIYVGKRRSYHAVRQEEINSIMLELAQSGKRVVRLKGGDPFIFGRGGEEIEKLANRDVPFQIVPGVTAASGCACYAGIPLTHRDYSKAVVFVTGHTRDEQLSLPWPQLVQPMQTVVIYMGLMELEQLCRQLIEHGMSPEMPMALVERGTTPQQRVLIATVGEMPELARREAARAPTLLIVGEVVRLQDKLKWFESSPR